MSSEDSDSKTKHSIIELTADQAREFLLTSESYCTIDLPPYIDFDDILNAVDAELNGKNLSGLHSRSPRKFDDVNYIMLNNKDGSFAWRPLSLIHPAIYVSLVHQITKDDNWSIICARFEYFNSHDKIQCLSLPVESCGEETNKAEQISQWWREFEQKSIELSIDYEYIIETDITDCYCSIYTHTIAWAIHTKTTAKVKWKNRELIGNIIDSHIMDMSQGQTNGIPQGSVLMDFIAEMVLGYADLELNDKLNDNGIEDYRILRYRDDYRIFVNNPQVGNEIIKLLTEIMIDLGLKLNSSKTQVNNSVIQASIKDDKLNWMFRKQVDRSIQKHLLIIHDHSMKFPNTGSLAVALDWFYKRIMPIENYNQPFPLISIIVDIAYHNPRTYPICTAILSKLLNFIDDSKEKRTIIDKIMFRFSKIPNTNHMQIWLQRVTLPFIDDMEFDESICQIVSGTSSSLWNNEWISSHDLKRALSVEQIIDRDAITTIEPIIPISEIELYISKMKEYA